MRLPKYSHPPQSVSSDFGQLAVLRHLISGIDCAIAGAATAVEAATPAPAVFRNSRRFIWHFPCSSRPSADATGLRAFLLAEPPDERLGAILRKYWRKPIEKPGAEWLRVDVFAGLFALRTGDASGS